MYVVFVSIDKPERWSQWHSLDTDTVYYSDFFNTKKDAKKFIDTVKEHYPDSNLVDGRNNHTYYIRYVLLQYNPNDVEGFKTLCRMMGAYNSYNNRKID